MDNCRSPGLLPKAKFSQAQVAIRDFERFDWTITRITKFIADSDQQPQAPPPAEKITGRGKKNYSVEDLDDAVRAYNGGAKLKRVRAQYPGIPERTIRHRAKQLKSGVALQKPGPPSALGDELEGHLHDWIVAMQRNGQPVNRETVLSKANEMYRTKNGITRSTGFLTIRWVSCFLKRHPDLSLRTSQVIMQARNEMTMDSLREFFWSS